MVGPARLTAVDRALYSPQFCRARFEDRLLRINAAGSLLGVYERALFAGVGAKSQLR